MDPKDVTLTPEEIASRVRFIEHKGIRILYIDSKDCSWGNMIAVLEEAMKYFRRYHNLRTLDDFRGAFATKEYIELAKKYGKELISKRRSKAAAIGIVGIKKILLDAYNAFTSDKLVVHKTMEEALDYLAKD
ncbi:MAG: hypothetical protein GF334_04465 [Candidatus Altiarchaeales archaeon]|nr:hypothetical protein [Candidatus Altiarchaeales archaeon]